MMSSSAPEPDGGSARTLALVATLVVLGTILSVFVGLTEQFGGTPWLVFYVGLAFVVATLLARRAPTRVGIASGAAVLGLGLVGYIVLLPSQYYGLFTVDSMIDDLAGWLTGRSVVLMLEADLWALGVAPAPVLLTWYLSLRSRYDAAALAGGASLGFFVLTGDLGEGTTLVGVAGLLALLGAGAVATTEGNVRQLQEIGLVVGLAILFARVVRVVPASGRGGFSNGGGPRQSLEEELLSNPDRLEVGGRPTLSAAPRFTIQAEGRAHWHTRSFDHYGGTEWRRTDIAPTADRPLDPPPSGTTLQQTVTVESPTGSMPAAWKPVLLSSDARDIGDVGTSGNLEPNAALEPGTRYEVISEVPAWTEADLADAERNYRMAIGTRYTQLPEDLPDRLVAKTEEIVHDADGPYETAVTIQEWLEANKDYSLDVERRNWDIADAFVFALDSGYCVYFATAMTVMLRIADVPARFVVGYAPGEDAGDGSWLVRGYHSHAWVEVYFPDVGWVTFDPTPSAPREQAQQRERRRARRQGDRSTTATERTETETPTATPTPTASTTENTTTADRADSTPQNVDQLLPAGATNDEGDTGTVTEQSSGIPGAIRAEGDESPTPTPSTGNRGRGGGRLWLLGAMATLAFGSVRLGYAQSAFRSVWKRWQPRSDDPNRDVERALSRLEYHLESEFRPREEGETRQQYLDRLRSNPLAQVDERTWRVLDIYQRSRYGDGVDRVTADAAIDLVNEIVRG